VNVARQRAAQQQGKRKGIHKNKFLLRARELSMMSGDNCEEEQAVDDALDGFASSPKLFGTENKRADDRFAILGEGGFGGTSLLVGTRK
jgi:hypothetical protein